MERYLLKTLSSFFVAALAVSCSSSASESNATLPVKNLSEHEVVAPTPVPTQNGVLTEGELRKLKVFAESYQPRSGREAIPSPPILNDDLALILAKAADSNSREHEKYLVLIYLRLYRFHLENFKQSYDLGRTNPLTKEFYRLVGKNDFETAEFNPSYLAAKYVEANPELMTFKLIDGIWKKIKSPFRKFFF